MLFLSQARGYHRIWTPASADQRKGLQMKNWLYHWGPAILIMAIIFIASAIPGNDIPGFGVWDFIVKKGGHMLGYALLASACYHALNNGRLSRKWLFVFSLCIAALYAASDEWHQTFTPGRKGTPLDVGVDLIGGTIGILVSSWVQKRFPARNRTEGIFSDWP
jgi:hypothetical protein